MCILCDSRIITNDCPTANASISYGINFTASIASSIDEIADAPADISTPYTVGVGDIFHGNLSTGADDDWVRLDMVEGQTYVINLDGYGSNGVEDTYLDLHDAVGTFVQSNDDANGTYFSEMTVTATSTGPMFFNAGSFGDAYAGDYTLSVERKITDSITWHDGQFTASSIEVSFMLDGQDVDDDGLTVTSDGFSAAQMADIQVFLDYLTDFTNLNITYSTNNIDADVRLATTNIGGSTLGYMYPQNTSTSDGLGIFTSDSDYWNTDSTAIGGFMYSVIIHELGHGLGLAHTHDTGGGSAILPGVFSSSDLGSNGNMNQSVYSVMSYNEGWQDHPLGLPADDTSGYMTSFAALDIAVLQSYYGVNAGYRTGNDTYDLGTDNFYHTLWDAGGIDTVQVTDDTGSYVNLYAATLYDEIGGGGNVSYTNSVIGGFTIANGALIENAKGAAGADELVGNDADNDLRGFAGNDTLHGNGGNDLMIGADGRDTIYGGSGDDSVFSGAEKDKVYGGDGDDSIYGNTGDDLLFGEDGNDLIVATDGNDVLNGGEGNDALYANNGDDRFFGGTGDDSVFGGKGQDLIYGGEGDDNLIAGNQDDTVYGNEGNDTLFGGTNEDVLYGGYDNDDIGAGGSSDTVFGGFGDDYLKGAGGNDTVNGDYGNDSIEGGIGHDVLSGGSGNDHIIGGGDNDIISGGSGDDILIGSSGFDVFVFVDGFGNDTINDFAELNAQEDIDLSGVTNIVSYGDLFANHMTQVGADVVITDGLDTITVLNALVADMNNADFLF